MSRISLDEIDNLPFWLNYFGCSYLNLYDEQEDASQVKTAETIWQAKRKCPDLTLLPAHHGLYRDFSCKVNSLYQEYTDLVEPFGIDESWLDVTGTLHLFGGDGAVLADRLRDEGFFPRSWNSCSRSKAARSPMVRTPNCWKICAAARPT